MPDQSEQIKKIMNDGRTFGDLLASFSQKSILAFATLFMFLVWYGCATVESNWICGVSFFTLATLATAVFMWTESSKKKAAVEAATVPPEPPELTPPGE